MDSVRLLGEGGGGDASMRGALGEEEKMGCGRVGVGRGALLTGGGWPCGGLTHISRVILLRAACCTVSYVLWCTHCASVGGRCSTACGRLVAHGFEPYVVVYVMLVVQYSSTSIIFAM